jgi:hypothetical protein
VRWCFLACAGLAVALSACGGRSVAHETTAGDDDTDSKLDQTPAQEQPSSPETASCENACHQCFEASLPETCADACHAVVDAASAAHCGAALEALFTCREQKQTCDSRQCADQSNDFTICIIDYCDTHVAELLCTAPI